MSNEEASAEKPDFTFQLAGDIRERVENDILFFDLDFGRGTKPYKPAATVALSGALFNNDGTLARAWANRFREIFNNVFQDSVVQALKLSFHDAMGLALIEHGLAPFGKKEILRDHLGIVDKTLRARFGLAPGRPAQWTATELARAISEAISSLPPARRTYDKVTEKLQEKFPDKAPKTGESLRKTVRLLGIDWKQAKKIAAKRS